MNASNASLFYCARNYPGTVRFILRITKYMMTKKVDTYYRLMGKVLPDSDQKRMGKITGENRQKVLSANPGNISSGEQVPCPGSGALHQALGVFHEGAAVSHPFLARIPG